MTGEELTMRSGSRFRLFRNSRKLKIVSELLSLSDLM
jgi:hypothetical protein